MSTVDHGQRHIWSGDSPRTVRAYMFCDARPTPADVERLRAEAEARRRGQSAIEYR